MLQWTAICLLFAASGSEVEIRQVLSEWEAWDKGRLPFKAEFIETRKYNRGLGRPASKETSLTNRFVTVAGQNGERRSTRLPVDGIAAENSLAREELLFRDGRQLQFSEWPANKSYSIMSKPQVRAVYPTEWLWDLYCESPRSDIVGPWWSIGNRAWQLATVAKGATTTKRLTLATATLEMVIDLNADGKCFPVRSKTTFRYQLKSQGKAALQQKTPEGMNVEEWSISGIDPNSPVPFQDYHCHFERFENSKKTEFFDYAVKRTSVSRDVSDRDLLPSLRVSNGTMVQVEDKPTIRYEWRDGAIVASENTKAVAPLKAAKFFVEKSESNWSRYLIAASVAVGALLIVIMQRRRVA